MPLAVDFADAASGVCFDLCRRAVLQELKHITVFYVGFLADVRRGKKPALDPGPNGQLTDTVSLRPQSLMDLPDASGFVYHNYPPFLAGWRPLSAAQLNPLHREQCLHRFPASSPKYLRSAWTQQPEDSRNSRSCFNLHRLFDFSPVICLLVR